MFAHNRARDNPSLCIFAVDFEDTRDEDYDSDGNPDKKLSLMIDTIKDVSSKSLEELHEMYWDMMPILKHNQELLLSQKAINWNA